MELLIDSCNGIHIPQMFARYFNMEQWHVKDTDAMILDEGSENPNYWDVWDEVITYAYRDYKGIIYNLYVIENGDLFAVKAEEMNKINEES